MLNKKVEYVVLLVLRQKSESRNGGKKREIFRILDTGHKLNVHLVRFMYI